MVKSLIIIRAAFPEVTCFFHILLHTIPNISKFLWYLLKIICISKISTVNIKQLFSVNTGHKFL